MASARGSFAAIRDIPGVYLMVDLDEAPLYAGKSRQVRTRLQQHFVRQDSSATADGLLDIYDVLRVYIWYCADSDLDAYETALHDAHHPRWNRARADWMGTLPALRLDQADDILGILDTPEQIAVRRQPFERAESKLLHLLRAVRKAKISGASPGIRTALANHAEELSALLRKDG